MTTPTASGCESVKCEASSKGESWFLSFPSPVITVLVQKIAEVQLGCLLNMRMVCKTTKSWVDDYPELKAGELMSNAQVRMGIDLGVVKRFNLTSPSFPVTSLTLNAFMKVNVEQYSYIEYEPEWNQYFDYWKPRLESLTIQESEAGEPLSVEERDKVQYIIRKLFESPRLKKVTILGEMDWNLVTPFPETFMNVTDLIMNGTKPNNVISAGLCIFLSDGMVDQFFSKMENNKNLKKLSVSIRSSMNLLTFKKFIEANKQNSQLKMIITIEIEKVTHDLREAFTDDLISLVRTAAAAECQIIFHLGMNDPPFLNRFFTTAKKQLSPADYFKFTNEQIEYMFVEDPLDDPSVLDIQYLEGLKHLGLRRLAPEGLMNFTFPPNLIGLGCGSGFPTVGILPLSITELVLQNVRCGLSEIEKCMADLGAHCVNLNRLRLFYSCTEKTPIVASMKELGSGDHETAHFSNLKSLIMKIYIESEDQQQEIAQEIILNRVRIDQMRLEHLVLSTHRMNMPGVEDNELQCPGESFARWDLDRQFSLLFNRIMIRDTNLIPIEDPEETVHCNYLALLDETILTRFCEGPISSSILFFDTICPFVSPSGIPVWEEKLVSILSGNVQNRIETEGRGPWHHQYPPKDQYYWTG